MRLKGTRGATRPLWQGREAEGQRGGAEPGRLSNLEGWTSSLHYHWPVTQTGLGHGLCPPASPGPHKLLETNGLRPPHPSTCFACPEGAAHSWCGPRLPGTGREDRKNEGPGSPKRQIRTPPKASRAAGRGAARSGDGAVREAPPTSATGPALPAAPGGSLGPQHLQLPKHLRGHLEHAVIALTLVAAVAFASTQLGHVSRSEPRPRLAGLPCRHALVEGPPPFLSRGGASTAPSHWAAASRAPERGGAGSLLLA